MELKTLILGLVFSIGTFAVKSGAGLSHLLATTRRGWPAVAVMAGFVGGYSLLFAAVFLTLTRVDLVAHLQAATSLFKSGILLHLLLAGLLAWWGVILLRRQGPDSRRPSRGWLLLALPCPVCFTVLLFGGGFLQTLYPEQRLALPLLFGGFLAASLTTALLLARLPSTTSLEKRLGGMMLAIGCYFVLTLAITPQWQGAATVYRLAAAEPTPSLPRGSGLLLTSGFFLFAVGFVRAWRASRHRHHPVPRPPRMAGGRSARRQP